MKIRVAVSVDNFPSHFVRLLENKDKQITRAAKLAKQLLELREQYDKFAQLEEFVHDTFYHDSYVWDVRDLPHSVKDIAQQRAELVELYSESRLRRFVGNTLERWQSFEVTWHKSFEQSYLLDEMHSYGYTGSSFAEIFPEIREYYPTVDKATYLAFFTWCKIHRELDLLVTQIKADVPKLLQYLKNLVAAQALEWSGDLHKTAPGVQPVETLWHVSLFAREIATNGWAHEVPEGRHGLGRVGSALGNPISFSYELAGSKELLRFFREAWQIVHGQVRWPQLVRWITDAGGDLKTILKQLENNRTSRTPAANTSNTEWLYLVWDCFMLLTRQNSRTYPWVFGRDDFVESLRKCKYTDIGVLECTVTIPDEYRHNWGERELAIPVTNVLTTKLLPW